MAMEETGDLNGKRIVVVEDDFVLATDICRTLRELGATVLGPAPTPFYAMHLIGGKKIDAAVLDVRLHAHRLVRPQIPPIEGSHGFKACGVQNGRDPLPHGNQLALPQLLDGSVDVNGR